VKVEGIAAGSRQQAKRAKRAKRAKSLLLIHGSFYSTAEKLSRVKFSLLSLSPS
jgi:hypothetical protein